jgi:seryl-tRNA synthetase
MLQHLDQCSSNRPNPSDHDVLSKLEGYDPERGVKVVGHRGYFLKKWGVFLNQCVPQTLTCLQDTDTGARAIINYGLEFLSDKDFTPLQTPQLMLREQMAKTAQLSQ